jgi:hypothetical protein
VTDSTAESAQLSAIQAAHAQAEVNDRQRNIRRGIAAAAVLLIHIFAIGVFIYSNKVPIVARIKATVPEAIFVLMPKPASPKPPVIETHPQEPEEPLPVITAPITLPPTQSQLPSRPLPPPPNGGLAGIGRSLACGASSYENLTALQREQCLRHPWHFIKRPDGTIVLEPPPKPAEPQPSIADIMRHEQQTAPPCPILNNVPCLGKVMHGDPLGGGPQPF